MGKLYWTVARLEWRCIGCVDGVAISYCPRIQVKEWSTKPFLNGRSDVTPKNVFPAHSSDVNQALALKQDRTFIYSLSYGTHLNLE